MVKSFCMLICQNEMLWWFRLQIVALTTVMYISKCSIGIGLREITPCSPVAVMQICKKYNYHTILTPINTINIYTETGQGPPLGGGGGGRLFEFHR